MERRPLLLVTVALSLLAIIAPRDLSASTILVYEGQPYTSVHNDPQIVGEYHTFMRMTGWVELADPLDPNCVCTFTYGETNPDPDGGFSDGFLGFSFFDGVWVYGVEPPSTMGIEGATFAFTTDASGDIVGWDIYMFNLLAPGVPTGAADVDVFLSSITGDYGQMVCDNCLDDPQPYQSFGSSLAGRWTLVTVPEPASLSLLLLGVAGVGLARRAVTHR
jgi:hypothetical protein